FKNYIYIQLNGKDLKCFFNLLNGLYHCLHIIFTFQLFTDGITNKLIGCYVGDITDDVVLVRIYGNKTELLVDRDEEVKSFRVLQAHGCAPQLYCTFNNGLCYEFMQGEALDPEHVCNPDIFRLIARQLAKIHTIHAHNGWIPKSNLWLKMGKYFSLIPTEFADEEVNKRFLRDIPSPQVLQEEMAWMKERLSNLGSPVVLCHNDLLCKNIIYNKKRGDVQFIDYEYSGYNYLAYDIGNHFNEFAGVNEVDYSLYPNRKLQEQWLRSYLEAYKEYKGFGTEVSEKEVEVLYVQVNQFALQQVAFRFGFGCLSGLNGSEKFCLSVECEDWLCYSAPCSSCILCVISCLLFVSLSFADFGCKSFIPLFFPFERMECVQF
uniref:ethanolamine kinase n=1 Tax=Buteo japonicus TaxID=224669 RepID=A0A8C0BMR3_9AVES